MHDEYQRLWGEHLWAPCICVVFGRNGGLCIWNVDKAAKGNGQGTALDVQVSEKPWKFVVAKNMA